MLDLARAEDSRATTWIVVALGAHAAILTVLLLLPMHAARISNAPTKDLELDVTVESIAAVVRTSDDRSNPAPTPENVQTPRTVVAAATRGSAQGEVIGDRNGTEVGGVTFGEQPADPAATPGAATTGVVPVPITPDQLGQLGLSGIGKSNPFLPKHEEVETKEAMNERASRPLRNSGLEADQKLGLSPAGPAISALNDSTRSSLAPLTGFATFVVRSDRDGLVSGIELIDSGGGSGWVDAGRLALEALKSKRFRVPSGANGLSMVIHVQSGMKLPNGQDSPVGARPGENNMPELTMPDVSNIGSAPRRVVKARVVSTEVL